MTATNYYDPALTQKRALAGQQYGLAGADYNWQKNAAQQANATQMASLTNQFRQQREALPGQYAGRGLLHSGIYAEGLANFNVNKQNQFAQLNQQYAAQQHNLNQGYAQAGQTQAETLNDIDLQEATARAQLAAQLKAVV